METHIGIVLKTCYSQVPDMTILDKQLGKIAGKIHMRNKNIRASHGSIITYRAIPRGLSYVLDEVDLAHVPFLFARQDIFFLHHILELCYYFLPASCVAEDVFDLLIYLFGTVHEKLYTKRRLILVRLFVLFGMYPEHIKVSDYIDRIMCQPLHQFLDVPFDGKINAWLDRWMWECIMSHPYKEQFKTVWLLKRTELHEG